MVALEDFVTKTQFLLEKSWLVALDLIVGDEITL